MHRNQQKVEDRLHQTSAEEKSQISERLEMLESENATLLQRCEQIVLDKNTEVTKLYQKIENLEEEIQVLHCLLF